MQEKYAQYRAFHEEHKSKKNRDYRLEVLKLSKEDVYDFLENKYADYIDGWRGELAEKTLNNMMLIQLLQKIVTQAGKSWYAEKESADWFNNNTPNVGQTIDYKSCPDKPEWLKEAEQILKHHS